MPTVQNRLHRYRYQLTTDQRAELGKLVAQTYQNSSIKKPIWRRKSVEPHGVFDVCDYHPDFNEIMDRVIKVYCQHKGISPIRRKKVIKKKFSKPAYSAKVKDSGYATHSKPQAQRPRFSNNPQFFKKP